MLVVPMYCNRLLKNVDRVGSPKGNVLATSPFQALPIVLFQVIVNVVIV